MTSILTVDDSASMRMAIRIALDGAGHNVVEAADGVEGLSKAREAKFDLIITDLNMPNMNGLEMIREIRRLPIQAGTPIICLTTESDDAMKQEAKSAGATGWLVMSIGVQSGPPIGVQKGPLCRGAGRLMLDARFALLAA